MLHGNRYPLLEVADIDNGMHLFTVRVNIYRHFDISRAITAESSPLYMTAAGLEPGTFDFRAQVANH